MQITDPKKLIIVAAIALIDADDQVLIAATMINFLGSVICIYTNIFMS